MALPIPKLTAQDYLAIERAAEYKSEYFNGEMFAMAGGSWPHTRIKIRIDGALLRLLDGTGCLHADSDMKIRVSPSGLYTYPDFSVICGKPVFADKHTDVVTNPKVIFEVLSPSTESKDRGFKFQQYKTIPTLEEYVLVSQSEPLVESFGRGAEGDWQHYSEWRGLQAAYHSRALGFDIPLAEIYQDIDFTAEVFI